MKQRDEPDWEKIKDVFALALEYPRESRADFLQRACGDDETLREEVESLLEAHNVPEPLIERNPYIASVIQSGNAAYQGRQFGKYRIVSEIGRGGMGTVFLAERADGEFNQKAAVKVVRRSFAEPELIRRFRQERQILAALNHPNIAQLFDGGVSDDGEPFLVMEYIEGVRIDEFCSEKNLSLKARLELFLHVCRAVGFAHQNLVVHRDIKPSNILVTADGVPKLLDFGIAKLLDAGANGGERTQTDYRVFTPEYAAPEQREGGKITTAADIYSLGVLLSKLIISPQQRATDRNRQTDTSGAETEASIQKPKTELEAVLQMARRAEPERRYATAAQFAEDIERYLRDLPVRARKDSFAYRGKKFIKRNKLAAAAAFLISFSLLGGLTVALWQADVARRERNLATKRFEDVRRLSNALLTDVAPKIERLQGSTEARQALVNQSLKYLDSLAREAEDDLSLQSELALAYEKIADLQGNPQKPNLSDFAGAIASYEKASAIRRNLPKTAENQKLLAENHHALSSVRYVQNDIENSLKDLTAALKIYEVLLTENPASFDLQISSIEAEVDYGQAYSSNNQHDIAIPLFRQALEKLEKLNQPDRRLQLLLAKTYSSLGTSLSWNADQAEAEIEMAKAVVIAKGLDAQNPFDANIQKAVWRVYILASSIYEGIKNEVSLEFAQKALQTARRAFESDNTDAQAKHNLAKTFSRIGVVLALLDKLSESSVYLNETEKILLELTAREPDNRTYQNDLGRLYTRFGDTKQKQGNLPGALESFQKSADYFEKISLADEKNTSARRDRAQSLKSVAYIHLEIARKSGDPSRLNHLLKAKNLYQQAYDILTRLKDQNAFSEFDEKLFDELQDGRRKTEEMLLKNRIVGSDYKKHVFSSTGGRKYQAGTMKCTFCAEGTFTSNQAEKDVRNVNVKQKISNNFAKTFLASSL